MQFINLGFFGSRIVISVDRTNVLFVLAFFHSVMTGSCYTSILFRQMTIQLYIYRIRLQACMIRGQQFWPFCSYLASLDQSQFMWMLRFGCFYVIPRMLLGGPKLRFLCVALVWYDCMVLVIFSIFYCLNVVYCSPEVVDFDQLKFQVSTFIL